MKRKFFILYFVCFWAGIALAQETPSPYAGEHGRAVKSLSEQEVRAYLSGHGMGLAKAAELNHHPGPKHVLELAEQLGLTDEQRRRTQQVYRDMHDRAVRLGEQIVAAEAELNAGFAESALDASALEEQVMQLGAWQGKLRFVHLHAHLQMREILSPAQIEKYDVLRGYKDDPPHGHPVH